MKRGALSGSFFLLAAVQILAAAPHPLTPEQIVKKWADGPVRYLMTWHEEEKLYDLNTPEEYARFITEFWQGRDPSPGTFENEYRRIARMFGGSYNAPDKELSVDRFVIKRRSDEFSIIFPSKSRVNLLVNIPFISWKIQLRTKDIKKGPTVDEVRERLTEMKARGYNIRLLQRVNGDFKAVVEFGPYDGEGLIECAREIAAFVEKGK